MRLHTLRMLLWSTLLAPAPAFCAGSARVGAADDSHARVGVHGDPAGRGGEERLVGGRSQLRVQF